MIAKIASIADAAEEEEDDQNDEFYVTKYHQEFALPEDQKLLTYFRCSLWQMVPTKGVLFISKDYACYTAATPHKVRVVIPFREILSVTKEATFGLIPNSVKVTCMDEQNKKKEKQYYITFILREEAYSTISQLWQRAIEQLQNPPVSPSSSNSPPAVSLSSNTTTSTTTLTVPQTPEFPSSNTAIADLYPPSAPPLEEDDESMDPSLEVEMAASSLYPPLPNAPQHPPTPNSFVHAFARAHPYSPNPQTPAPLTPTLVPSSPNPNPSGDPSKYGLDRERRNLDFQALFKLPVTETVTEEYWCSIWRKSYVVGKLYVSRNFCCFHANINKELTIVVSFYQIGSIQKERSMGFISNAIKVITLNGREFFFVLYNRDGAFATMNNLWKSHVQSNRKVKVPPLVDLSQFGYSVAKETEPKESEELINFKKQEWNKYFKKNGFAIDMLKTRRLRELVRNGINSDLRGPVWLLCSGAYQYWEVEPTLYSTLLEKYNNQASTATDEIEKDLHRTLANHAYFKTPEAIEQLRNVLTAYSWRNPEIGYCQAMNVVCAAMLLHTTEEAAFWLLSVICEDTLKGYYNTAMIGSIVDQKIFDDLVQSYLPKLYAHLDKTGLPVTVSISLNTIKRIFVFDTAQILSLPWFMCLFIGYIPWEVALRVIDTIFYEGSLVLFQVGLAVLKLNQDKILAQEDSERIVDLLKKREYDSEELMLVTFRDFEFTPDKLTELRNAHKYKTIRHLP